MSTNTEALTAPHDLLDRMQFRADKWADDTIGSILTPWSGLPTGVNAPPPAPGAMRETVADEATTVVGEASFVAGFAEQWDPRWKKIIAVNQVFTQWTDNQAIQTWHSKDRAITPKVAEPLDVYVTASRDFPVWGDRQKVARAEQLFMDYGPLSVALLFCSSLPECYVVPDLAAVLHTTGQLEKHTEYRIRSTGAMVFPVMMRGGMTTPEGGGVAQIFKVRLIHATIRNLILRGNPQAIIDAVQAGANTESLEVIPMLGELQSTDDMHQALFAHGWDVPTEGLPCNQEELAYTLLTFSYVFLRSMRILNLAFSKEDEEAYLHAWNVAGHFLGIERELMVDTYDEAAKLFDQMQARGRADWVAKTTANPKAPDPRPALGNALIDAMSSVIPSSVFTSFPLLFTRYLCGKATSKDLGLEEKVSWPSLFAFCATILIARVIDAIGRKIKPGFSITRLITRALGYQFMSKLLMDQTKPLKLPNHVLTRMNTMMATWGEDTQAGGVMNSIEDCFTVKGTWNKPA
ncbi:MAG: DUF2236 domain-containing protein [Betaproteobacteria bacterium]|nr:DUF2236 domain-containing protein [Betaproteobacteria bacterium]